MKIFESFNPITMKIATIIFSVFGCLVLGGVGGYGYVRFNDIDIIPPSHCSDIMSVASSYISYTTLICTIIAVISGLVGIILSNTISVKKHDILDELKKQLVKNGSEYFLSDEDFMIKMEEKIQDIAEQVLSSEEMQNLILSKVEQITKEKIELTGYLNTDPSRKINMDSRTKHDDFCI